MVAVTKGGSPAGAAQGARLGPQLALIILGFYLCKSAPSVPLSGISGKVFQFRRFWQLWQFWQLLFARGCEQVCHLIQRGFVGRIHGGLGAVNLTHEAG
jgi:hypothetical protein